MGDLSREEKPAGLSTSQDQARAQAGRFQFKLSGHPYYLIGDDLAALHVEALLKCLAHRKSLARQGAVQDDGLEQVVFIHAGQVKTDVPGLAPKPAHGLEPVHVVDLLRTALLHEDIQEALQRAHRQVRARIGDLHKTGRLFGDDPEGLLVLTPAFHRVDHHIQVRGGRKLVIRPEIFLHRRQDIFLQVEQDAVDRGELQPLVVDILDFHQGITRGVIHPHLVLVLFPDALGSG